MTLTEEMQRLSALLIRAYDSRMAAVEEIRREVVALLERRRTLRQQMAAEQRERLAAARAQLQRETTAFLREQNAAHQQMATQQRDHLTSDRAQLANDVATRRHELQADRQAAGATWRELGETLDQRRARQPETGEQD